MEGNGKSMVGKCGFFVIVVQVLNQIVFRDETRGIRSLEDQEDRRKRFSDSQTKTMIPMESENPRRRNRR